MKPFRTLQPRQILAIAGTARGAPGGCQPATCTRANTRSAVSRTYPLFSSLPACPDVADAQYHPDRRLDTPRADTRSPSGPTTVDEALPHSSAAPDFGNRGHGPSATVSPEPCAHPSALANGATYSIHLALRWWFSAERNPVPIHRQQSVQRRRGPDHFRMRTVDGCAGRRPRCMVLARA